MAFHLSNFNLMKSLQAIDITVKKARFRKVKCLAWNHKLVGDRGIN
jgi:hypothetical protein